MNHRSIKSTICSGDTTPWRLVHQLLVFSRAMPPSVASAPHCVLMTFKSPFARQSSANQSISSSPGVVREVEIADRS